MKSPLQIFAVVLGICQGCTGQIANENQVYHGIQQEQVSTGDTVTQTCDSILVTFQDSNGNYWFGSNGYGVYKYTPSITDTVPGKESLIHYTTKHKLISNTIWKIEEDMSGSLLFTTPAGICRYHGNSFSSPPVKTNPSYSAWVLNPNDIWLQGPTDSGLVYRYDGTYLYPLRFPKVKEAEEFISTHPRDRYPHINFSPYDVYSVYKDSNGFIWFGTISLGVCRFDGKNLSWISCKDLGLDQVAFGVRSILEDKEHKFWFSNGFYRFNFSDQHDDKKQNSGVLQFRKEEGLNTTRSDKEDFHYIMSFVQNDSGILWMATFSKGVWRFDGKTIENFKVVSGTKELTLFSLYCDRKGEIWANTHDDGVYKFENGSFKKFTL